MAGDEEFEPRLGRMRAIGGKGQKRFLHRIVAAANLAGGGPAIGKRSGFTGRQARGAGSGRVLAAGDRFAGYRARRVIVKSRIVRLAGKGGANARAHLRYLQRDGTTRDGEPGELYGPEQDGADGKAFLERGAGDRHQFRLIVSPEDGDQYPDLRSVTRRLMARMEEDLGTRLDWVAVDHFNTGHPHSHILLRGVDDRGRDLVMARDYLARGIRARAGEVLDFDLGPRSDLEIETRMRAEIGQERFTGIDRRLIAARDPDGTVLARGSAPLEQSLRAGRLAKLARMGLAESLVGDRWRLDARLEQLLREIGERGDILKTLHRTLAEHGIAREAADQLRFDPGASQPLVGTIVARGLADELRDRHYLVVDGIDGYAHHIDIGHADPEIALAPGMIVRVEAVRPNARAADHTVAAVAAANHGVYSVDAHLRHDTGATAAFADTHVRRLEAMRRAGVEVERRPDGSWLITADHADRAATYEARLAQARPVKITQLSSMPLDRLAGHDGETWLDRRLAGVDTMAGRDAGFGAAVRAAEQQRRAWLAAEGLVGPSGAKIAPDLLAVLRRRELLRVAGQLSAEMGAAYVETRPGARIEGMLERRVVLANGHAFGVLRHAKEFTLVPWRPIFDHRVGRSISGRAGTAGISWSIDNTPTRSVS